MIIEIAWWVIIGRWGFIKYVRKHPNQLNGESFQALKRNVIMVQDSRFIQHDMIYIIEKHGGLEIDFNEQ